MFDIILEVMREKTKPPLPGKLLYENLFANRSRDGSLELLSDGLLAVAENAEHLIGEAEILSGVDKYARADFILATADEEMAKSFILLDMCRLDFEKHEAPLKNLCHAFYSHVKKYAYSEIFRFDGCRDLNQAQHIFHSSLVKWWPSSGVESGEPDMPHRTYFTREANLYVDYIEYDGKWYVPRPEQNKIDVSLYKLDLKNSKEVFDRILFTRDNGLFRPEILDVVNDVFKGNYIKEDTSNDDLFRLFDKIAERLERDLTVPLDVFKKSIICEWPLYHFLQTGL